MTEIKKQSKMGRPRIPEHLKKKRTTRPMRVPVAIIDDLKALVKAYNSKTITVEDIQALINKGESNVK